MVNSRVTEGRILARQPEPITSIAVDMTWHLDLNNDAELFKEFKTLISELILSYHEVQLREQTNRKSETNYLPDLMLKQFTTIENDIDANADKAQKMYFLLLKLGCENEADKVVDKFQKRIGEMIGL
ncbi:MAG: hypothetical protein JXA43_02700 [Candidatus Diapherotrites archaeon]|nr:hypothetical protein [Candidatus Diapherotrites archaeon]